MAWKVFAFIFAILTLAGFSGSWRPFEAMSALELINLALSPLSAVALALYAWRVHLMASAVWRMYAAWKALLNLATAGYAAFHMVPRLAYASSVDGHMGMMLGFVLMLGFLALEWLGIRLYAELRQDREEGLDVPDEPEGDELYEAESY